MQAVAQAQPQMIVVPGMVGGGGAQHTGGVSDEVARAQLELQREQLELQRQQMERSEALADRNEQRMDQADRWGWLYRISSLMTFARFFRH